MVGLFGPEQRPKGWWGVTASWCECGAWALPRLVSWSGRCAGSVIIKTNSAWSARLAFCLFPFPQRRSRRRRRRHHHHVARLLHTCHLLPLLRLCSSLHRLHIAALPHRDGHHPRAHERHCRGHWRSAVLTTEGESPHGIGNIPVAQLLTRFGVRCPSWVFGTSSP